MSKYRISTGEIDGYEVEATSVEEAFKLTIEAHPYASLGILFCAEQDGEEDLYGHTMHTLNRVGITDQPLDELGFPIYNGEDEESDSILDTEVLS